MTQSDTLRAPVEPLPTLDDFRRMTPTEVNAFFAFIGSDWRVADAARAERDRDAVAVETASREPGQWPAAVSDGLTLACADCGDVPRFDYRVDYAFWRQWVPGPERLGVVCLPCLDKRCGGVGLAAALEEVQWTGIGHTVVLVPERRYEYAAATPTEQPRDALAAAFRGALRRGSRAGVDGKQVVTLEAAFAAVDGVAADVPPTEQPRDDGGLRAALERDPDAAAACLRSALDWLDHGDFHAAAYDVAALAAIPTEQPQQPRDDSGLRALMAEATARHRRGDWTEEGFRASPDGLECLDDGRPWPCLVERFRAALTDGAPDS